MNLLGLLPLEVSSWSQMVIFKSKQPPPPLFFHINGFEERSLCGSGLFPNHIPNPEDKEAMKAITQAVLANQADLGIIFDTDVDR